MQVIITAVGPDNRGLADPIVHYVTSAGANIAEIQMYDHDAEPRDEHRYNLFGLALLDSDPGAAVLQFKNALRCNLYYGPGWLNLAQAYANANDRPSAVQCLRHYMRFMPYGPQAGDARQRLAALEAGEADARDKP